MHKDLPTRTVVSSHLFIIAVQAVLYAAPTFYPQFWASLPLYLTTHVPVVLLASSVVFAGCFRSIKPSYEEHETLTKKDAIKFPFIGSAVLLSIFLAYKYLPAEILNKVVRGYFSAVGTLALTMAAEPVVGELLPSFFTREFLHLKALSIPYVLDPTDVRLSLCNVVLFASSTATSYFYFTAQPWILNNVLGLCFCLEGIEWLHLGSVSTGVLLLAGLFFYDIFWVFFTPVMVSVAKKFDGPIKLMFHRGFTDAGKPEFSILGLGDIVLPGALLSMVLKLDASRGYKSSYFRTAFIGYVVGLATTVLVMVIFSSAQPALLYIVPSVVLSILGHAWVKGEVKTVLDFTTDPPEGGEAKKEQ